MTMLRNVNIPETLTTDPYGFASRSWGEPRQMLHLGKPQDRTGSQLTTDPSGSAVPHGGDPQDRTASQLTTLTS